MMIGTDYPKDRLPPGDGKFLLEKVSGIISSADIAIGNLEGTLLDGGSPKKKCKDSTVCYLFRTPTKLAGNYKDAGFDALSLANNHVNDFGDSGKISAARVLDSLGVKYSGDAGTYAAFEKKD